MIDINKIIKIIVILCFKLFLCISVIAGLISLYKWCTYERHINKIEVKAEFASLLQRADAIFIEELKKSERQLQ